MTRMLKMAKNGQKLPKMDKNGQKWPKMAKMDENGQKTWGVIDVPLAYKSL